MTGAGTLAVTGGTVSVGVSLSLSASGTSLVLTGGTLISEDLGLKLENLGLEHTGRARKITVDKDSTTIVGTVRVALLADQDRKIVRIVPVHDCQGIGIASPKGTDPAGYRSVVQGKLNERFQAKPPASSVAVVTDH